MRCDAALRAISAAVDGELGPGHDDDGSRLRVVDDTDERLAEHIARCPTCADFQRYSAALRAQLRFEPVAAAPDVVAGVLDRISSLGLEPGQGVAVVTPLRPRPPLWPMRAAVTARATISAAAAVGFLAGMTFVGVGPDANSPAAADVPARIGSVQASVDSVSADIRVVEYGRPDRDGSRDLVGHLAYGGPEELELSLTETGPSRDRAQGGGSPGDGDVRLSVLADRWLLDAVRTCTPAPGRAACPAGATRFVREVSGREPFSEAAPLPFELVAPVDSFALAGQPPSLGERTVAGRRAVGVSASAAQIASFLDGLSPADDLRAVYPTDTVEMWLDRDTLVPLALVVYAADSPERRSWAASQGYDDEPGDRVLAFTTENVQIDDPTTADSATRDAAARAKAQMQAEARRVEAAAEARVRYNGTAGFSRREDDEGFRSAPTTLLRSVPASALPDGFVPARSGVVDNGGGPLVEVRSWSDGRAWVKVEATKVWLANHLFGDLGPAVRGVDLGDDAGRGYVSADGHKIGIHGEKVDLVVSGSLPTEQLAEIAAQLGVRGQKAPRLWRESRATSLAAAASSTPRLLIPTGLSGFGAPAVTVLPDQTVTQVYAGPGDRGFVLTQTSIPVLPPPTDDAVGVEVRGHAGRYSPAQSQLEWSERGASFSLVSPSLSLTELLDIAANLRAA